MIQEADLLVLRQAHKILNETDLQAISAVKSQNSTCTSKDDHMQ